MGKRKKKVGKKGANLPIVSMSGGKEKGQWKPDVDSGELCAIAVLVGSLHSHEHAQPCTTALCLGCFQRIS